MKKLLFFIVLLLLMSSCAYQRYAYARKFQPDKVNKVMRCNTYDDVPKYKIYRTTKPNN